MVFVTLSLALIPNQLRATAKSGEDLIKLWEKGVDGKVFATSWSPTNSYLAVGASNLFPKNNGTLIIFNSGGNAIWSKKLSSGILSLSWGPKGKVLAVGSFSMRRGGHLILFGLNGSLLMNKSLQKYVISGISWSPDGKELALLLKYFHWSGVLVLDLSGRKLWSYGVPGPVLSSISWRPEGDLMAVGSDLGSMYFINRMGEVVKVIKGLGQYITRVSWSPDGSKLAVGTNNSVIVLDSKGSRLRVWRTESSKPLPYWGPNGVMMVSFKKNQITLTDTSTNKTIVRTLDTKVNSVSWSSKNMILAVGGEYEVIAYKLLLPQPKESEWLLTIIASVIIVVASAALIIIKKLRP